MRGSQNRALNKTREQGVVEWCGEIPHRNLAADGRGQTRKKDKQWERERSKNPFDATKKHLSRGGRSSNTILGTSKKGSGQKFFSKG